MTTVPRLLTEELGGSPLARAVQRGELSAWYRRRPVGVDQWRTYVRGVTEPHISGNWVRELSPAIDASGAAAERLKRTADEGGVVVSTGQQAALFGGPLYTLVKALSALAIADCIERTTGVRAVPVFWAATDDADFVEACCTRVVLDSTLSLLQLPDPVQPGIPMSAIALGDVSLLLARLTEASGSVVDDEPLDAVRRSHAPGTTLGDAYVRLLRALLHPLGVAVIDASHPTLRRAAGSVFTRALDRARDVERALTGRVSAITSAGFAPQVDPVPGLSLVFSAEPGRVKSRIPIESAADAARRRPSTALAANVLLRPVIERAIMPSAAYIGGPGELAYFAEVSAVADALDMPTPLVLPRWSVTILEPRIERLLTRLGIARDVLVDAHGIETSIARKALPSAIVDAIAKMRRDVVSDAGELMAADGEQLVPPASVEALQRRVLHRLERTERRYVAAMKRRESESLRDVAALRASLLPGGQRQERVLNFIPFLARYGRPLLEAMREEATRHARHLVEQETPVGRTSDDVAVQRA